MIAFSLFRFLSSLFKPVHVFRMRIFFACVVLLAAFAPHAKAQNDDAYVTWYRSFFQPDREPSPDELLTQARARLDAAIQQNDAPAQAKAFVELALVNLTEVNDYEQALGWLIKSLSLEDSLRLNKERILTYLAMARVFEQVRDYERAAGFLAQARTLNSELASNDITALVLQESGQLNTMSAKYNDAATDYGLLLEYADELRQPELKADALYALAELLVLQQKFDDALATHKKALALRRQQKNEVAEAASLNAIGKVYGHLKNKERALANHVAAIQIRLRINDQRGLAESYYNAARLYYELKNYRQSIANLELALKAAKEESLQELLRTIYDQLSLNHKALKNYQAALTYRELFQAMHELIESEKDARQLVEAQSLYIINQKESEINQLEDISTQRAEQLKAQMKLRNFLFLIIGLAIIIVVLIFYLYILNRQATRKLRAANAQVQQQNEKLQEVNAAKDKFFSIIGHDLKGPLNSLTSFSGLLMNHTDSLSKEEIRMVAKDLDKSLKNLFALLENLLEWSRAQTGGIEFTPEIFDLNTVVEENKALLQAQASQKEIEIQFEHNGPLSVNAHKHSVNTVVRNLMSNAIKFTKPGGTVTVSAQAGKGEVLVAVADTGVGIPSEVKNKLFRLDTKHSTKGTADEKGTGLGLILCKEFIEKNGGSIGVDSEEGKGSTFYFTIPLKK